MKILLWMYYGMFLRYGTEIRKGVKEKSIIFSSIRQKRKNIHTHTWHYDIILDIG